MSDERPRFLPHVLVITGDTADEREYEIEHPDGCPVVCHWSPHMREIVERMSRDAEEGRTTFGSGSPDFRDCYVQYEVEGVGLDGLDLGDNPPGDCTYTPASKWSMDGWRRLPPGRYVIEAWHHQGTGLMPWGEDESEGGLNLIGPA